MIWWLTLFAHPIFFLIGLGSVAGLALSKRRAVLRARIVQDQQTATERLVHLGEITHRPSPVQDIRSDESPHEDPPATG